MSLTMVLSFVLLLSNSTVEAATTAATSSGAGVVQPVPATTTAATPSGAGVQQPVPRLSKMRCLFPGVPESITRTRILPFLHALPSTHSHPPGGYGTLGWTLRQLFQTCASADAGGLVARIFFDLRMRHIEQRFSLAAQLWEAIWVEDMLSGRRSLYAELPCCPTDAEMRQWAIQIDVGATTVRKCGPVRECCPSVEGATGEGIPCCWTDVLALLPDANVLQQKIMYLDVLSEQIWLERVFWDPDFVVRVRPEDLDPDWDRERVRVWDLRRELKELQGLSSRGAALFRREEVRRRALLQVADPDRKLRVGDAGGKCVRDVQRLLLPGRVRGAVESTGKSQELLGLLLLGKSCRAFCSS